LDIIIYTLLAFAFGTFVPGAIAYIETQDVLWSRCLILGVIVGVCTFVGQLLHKGSVPQDSLLSVAVDAGSLILAAFVLCTIGYVVMKFLELLGGSSPEEEDPEEEEPGDGEPAEEHEVIDDGDETPVHPD